MNIVPMTQEAPAATAQATAPATDKKIEPSVATAVADVTERSRSKLEQLLALIPVDKQAQANDLLLALFAEVRDGPVPARNPSKLAIGKGTRYRRADREPEGARAADGHRI